MNLKRKQQPGPAAVAAAEWWAEAIGHPVHRITDDNSGPEDQRLGGDYAMLAALVGSRAAPVTSDKARAFADAVAEHVQSELDRLAKVNLDYLTLAVDYGPDHHLGEAARASGIAGIHFPSKTCMWIHSDHVTVSAGYRAETRLVWASEEWQANRPTCRSQEWHESEWRDEEPHYSGEPYLCSLPLYHEEQHRYDQPIALCATCARREDASCHGEDRVYTRNPHDFEPLPAGQRFEVSAQ